MSESKIDAALVTAYRAAMPALVNVTAYEPGVGSDGKPFTPPVATKWAQLTNLRASANPVTLGKGGEDEHSGVFQIDVNVPESNASAKAILLADADTLKAYFVAGRNFIYSGQCVHVRRADASPIRRIDGWLRLSVSVFYTSRSTRGTF